MSLSYLRSVMVGESKAYGFTIAFWGSGTMLVSLLGLPTLVEALAFGSGAVLGFGVLAIFAFRGALENVEKQDETELLVFSTIHYISALVPILISYLIGVHMDSWQAFLLAGMNISIFYNLLMVLEKTLAEEGVKIEKKVEKILG